MVLEAAAVASCRARAGRGWAGCTAPKRPPRGERRRENTRRPRWGRALYIHDIVVLLCLLQDVDLLEPARACRLALRGCPSVAIAVFTVQVRDVLEGALASGQDVVQTVRQLLEGATTRQNCSLQVALVVGSSIKFALYT